MPEIGKSLPEPLLMRVKNLERQVENLSKRLRELEQIIGNTVMKEVERAER